jgi:DNA-binding LacI/PurR family transcriptional regulator
MGQYVDPPLTTVAMPFAEMGEMAADNPLALLAGDSSSIHDGPPHRLHYQAPVTAMR